MESPVKGYSDQSDRYGEQPTNSPRLVLHSEWNACPGNQSVLFRGWSRNVVRAVGCMDDSWWRWRWQVEVQALQLSEQLDCIQVREGGT